MSLISELKRRNVIRAALFYLAGSWLLIQVAETIFPLFGFPDAAVRMVVTISAIGFLPAMMVSWAFEWTPEGLKKDEGKAGGRPALSIHAKAWDRVIIVVLALALGLFAFDRFVLAPQREADLFESATQAGVEMEKARASTVPDESVAVLPFINLSGNPGNEYLSDGLANTLMHMLTQLADLKVAARISSFAFKGKNVDVREIGKALSVAHVLEGTVQTQGDRIRITAQLVRADNGYHVWSQSYDRTMEDIFAIQDEIAEDVAGILGSQLLAGNNIGSLGPATADISAYDIYLRAMEQQATGSFDALSRADELFRQSLDKDASFTDAKIALVRNNYLRGFAGAGEYETDMEDSRRWVEEVLAVEPSNLEARQYEIRLRADEAYVNMDINLRNALMQELVETFENGQGDTFLLSIASNWLVAQSRPDEALNLLKDALVSDPLNVDLLLAQANLLRNKDGPDAAEQPLKTALTVQPDNPEILRRLGLMEFGRRQLVEGLRYMRKLELIDPLDPQPTAEIAATLTEVGLYEAARLWMADYRSRQDDYGAVLNLEIQLAAERGDEAELRRIVPRMLDDIFKGRIAGGAHLILLREYAVIMLREDRAQEGLDYLESFRPGIAQVSTEAVTGWGDLRIRTQAVGPLFRAVSDSQSFMRFQEATLAFLASRGVVITDENPAIVGIRYHNEGLESAKAAFFSIYNEDLYILSFTWNQFKRVPWAAELRADPDIIAVMDAREARIAELREEVLALMAEPEWQR